MCNIVNSDKFGEFVIDMVVIVDKTVYDAKEDFEMTVEQALTEEVEDGISLFHLLCKSEVETCHLTRVTELGPDTHYQSS